MLERIAVGEIAKSIGSDEKSVLSTQLDEIRASNREILEQYPADRVAGLIRKRMSGAESDDDMTMTNEPLQFPAAESSVAARRIPGFAFAAAAAILVISGVLATVLGRSGTDPIGPIRIKGEGNAVINIYRQVDNNAELLAEKSIVSEHDLLQISYDSAGKAYGAVLSIDGRGVVTVHFPYENTGAGELTAGGENPLEYSYRLDDAPRFERFFFLTSDNVFNMTLAVSAVRALTESSTGGLTGRLSLPEDIEQYSVSLIKETHDE